MRARSGDGFLCYKLIERVSNSDEAAKRKPPVLAVGDESMGHCTTKLVRTKMHVIIFHDVLNSQI